MYGNVFEWCWDFYREDYYKDSPATDPMGPTRDDPMLWDRGHVLRGGSYGFGNKMARCVYSAHRSDDTPWSRGYSVGFRAARTLPPVSLTSLPPTP